MVYAYVVSSILFWCFIIWIKGDGLSVSLPFAFVAWGVMLAVMWLAAESVTKLWGLF